MLIVEPEEPEGVAGEFEPEEPEIEQGKSPIDHADPNLWNPLQFSIACYFINCFSDRISYCLII